MKIVFLVYHDILDDRISSMVSMKSALSSLKGLIF